MATTEPDTTLRLEVAAGDADLPRLAQSLGPIGVNPVAVKQACDQATRHLGDLTVRIGLTVHPDRSFDLRVLAPATAALVRQAAGVPAGSGRPNIEPVGRITRAQLRDIAHVKLPELTTDDPEAAERIVAGTARSMGATFPTSTPSPTRW